MVCAPVRSIIPLLKLGDYLSVQSYKPNSISHFFSQSYPEEVSCLLMLLSCGFLSWKLRPNTLNAAEFTKSVDSDESAHHEPPHQDLHCLSLVIEFSK